MLKKILHPKLSYKITGLCFQVNNELGRFAREKQYADRLEQLLKTNQIKYKRELEVPFQLKEDKVTGNIVDFLVEDKIILECKAKKFVTKKDYYQVQRYLQATDMELGLIVNFNERHLKPKRILNCHSYHS